MAYMHPDVLNISENVEEGVPIIDDGAEKIIPQEEARTFREFLSGKKDLIDDGGEDFYIDTKGETIKISKGAMEVVRSLLPGDDYEVKELLDLRRRFNPSIYEEVGLEKQAAACLKAIDYLEQDL
jgi:hypothetical protein